MNKRLKKSILFLLPAAGLLTGTAVNAQNAVSDTLSLGSIISEVVQNHPLVKKAQEEISNSDAKIGMAQSGTLPNIDVESSYSRIGPITNISLPGIGSFSLMPHDNYSASVNASQMLYDFGKTNKNIQLEKQGKELSVQSVEQVKQKLAQAVIGYYFALDYLQEAVKIKDDQLRMLNEHLQFIRKKLETGSATNYEILTTEVRISNTENEKTDLLTAIKVKQSQLNSLLGRPESNELHVKNEVDLAGSGVQGDSLVASAMKNRDELKLAREKEKLAQLRLSLVSAQNNPVFSAFFSGGLKNGYIPYMNDPRANFAVGAGLRIPLFDGHRKEFSQVQAQTAIQQISQETEITRRTIVDEVVEAEAALAASKRKVDQTNLQLNQALQAYDLAKVKFDSGVITNLELIEASTTVSETRLMVQKSKIDYTVDLLNLKAAVGERLY